jgi:alpha-galactosidase
MLAEELGCTERRSCFINCLGVFISVQLFCSSGAARGQATVPSPAPAIDVTGKWVGSVQAPFGKLEYYFEFQMDKDGTLHGVQHSNAGDVPISDGRVEGNVIRFTEETESYGTLSTSRTTGEIVGDQIKLIQPPRRRRNAPAAGGGTSAQPAGSGPPSAAGAVVGGNFTLPPVLLHRGQPAPSFRAGPLNYRDLPKSDLPAITDMPANGLAQKPPMGWNSWNKFATNIDDKTLRGVADAIASNGMKDAGYQYIVIDDGWEWKRDNRGKIVPNPNFPDMKALATYVHSKGLKIGIYSSPGPRTCGGYEGSYGHEEQDAQSYADWGFDYLKYDWCSGSRAYQEADMRAAYQKMGAALRKSGRPIVYALCQYGRDDVEQWGPAVGANLWRTTGDISDRYQSMTRNGFSETELAAFAAPGHWNDPDMLEVGNGGMSNIEYQTHFSLWAILAAPLLAGNDVRSLNEETREILLNKEVISVDQDALGKQGFRVSQHGDAEVWAKPLENGAYAIGLFNRSDTEQAVSTRWAELKLRRPKTLRNLWTHEDVTIDANGFSETVPAHGVIMLKVGM